MFYISGLRDSEEGSWGSTGEGWRFMELHIRRPAGQAVRRHRLSIRWQYNRVIPGPIGRVLAGLGVGSLSLLAPAWPACAMDFVQTQVTATEAVVSGRGRITPATPIGCGPCWPPSRRGCA